MYWNENQKKNLPRPSAQPSELINDTYKNLFDIEINISQLYDKNVSDDSSRLTFTDWKFTQDF